MNKFLRFLVLIIFMLFICSESKSYALVQDELVNDTLKNKSFEKPYNAYKYNYEDLKRIPIELRVIADIKSEKDITEGETIIFVACHDVYSQARRVLKKGDYVYAKVETIIKSGMNGIPASIIFGDFKFENIDSSKVSDTYEVYGQDRSLWVYPLKWALTILPPTGSLTNFIKGGHAKLKENHTIEIYYHPNW